MTGGNGAPEMAIGQACDTVRLWSDLFTTGSTRRTHPGDLVGAVAVLKRYLEAVRGDGRPVLTLEIAAPLLATREGIRAIMPFVLIAEALQARADGAAGSTRSAAAVACCAGGGPVDGLAVRRGRVPG